MGPSIVPVWLVVALQPRAADSAPLSTAPETVAETPPQVAVEPPLPPMDSLLEDPEFGPRYVIEKVIVRGNRRTATALILREIGLREGDVVAASDRRVDGARHRLLATGYFLEARFSMSRGDRRGRVNLVVEVEERGTLLLAAIYGGSSEATSAWAGLDLAETNLLGRGLTLAGGVVVSSRPEVPGAVPARGFRLRVADGSVAGSGLGLSGTVLASGGSEFYRAAGTEAEATPGNFVAARITRRGGIAGLSAGISRTTRLLVEARFEGLTASLPGVRSRDAGPGDRAPIVFAVHEGESRLATIATTLDIDTRSDPVLPRSGARLGLTIEVASPVYASSYAYAKGSFQASAWKRIWRGHVLGFHGLAGAIFGDAPYFDRFFVGDLNLLVPPRALGLVFSTQPSRNILGTTIQTQRSSDFAARALIEYVAPLWRRRGFFYRGDAFIAGGVFGLAGLSDLRVRDRPLPAALPLDLTGDFGLRLDTEVGVFSISAANGLARLPF